MNPTEVKNVVQHLTELRRPDVVLCHAVAHRVGQLVSRATVQGLCQVADLVLLIEEHPKLFSAFDVNGSLRQMLEVRLASLNGFTTLTESVESGSTLEVLTFKYEQTAQLVSRGLASSRCQELAEASLHRWLEHAPLTQLQRELPAVAKPAQVDDLIAASLAQRFAEMHLLTLNLEQLKLLASSLIDLHQSGVKLLDAQLEGRFAKQLQRLVKIWPRARLVKELRVGSGLMILCHASTIMRQAVLTTMSEFLSRWMLELLGSLACMSDLESLKEDFDQWCGLVQLADTAGLVAFSASAHDEVLGAFCSCASKCVETAELRDVVKDMHMQVIVLMSGNAACKHEGSGDAVHDAHGAATTVTDESAV